MPSYVTQFKQRLNWNQETEQIAKTSRRRDSDVMKDFPMRDYHPKRPEYFYHDSHDSFNDHDTVSHGSPAMHDNGGLIRYRPDFHGMDKPLRHKQTFAHSGGALPDEAYQAQKIHSGVGVTKELSASELMCCVKMACCHLCCDAASA